MIEIGDPGNILLFNGFIFQKCGSIECNKDLFWPLSKCGVFLTPGEPLWYNGWKMPEPQRVLPFRGIETTWHTVQYTLHQVHAAKGSALSRYWNFSFDRFNYSRAYYCRKGFCPFAVLKLPMFRLRKQIHLPFAAKGSALSRYWNFHQEVPIRIQEYCRKGFCPFAVLKHNCCDRFKHRWNWSRKGFCPFAVLKRMLPVRP